MNLNCANDIIIRPFCLRDLIKLNLAYDFTSEEVKKFFVEEFLGFKNISLKWLIRQVALTLSSITLMKKLLMRLYYRAVYLPLVAINRNHEVVGFAYLKIKHRLAENKYLAVLGIYVMEDYQGKNFGSKMIECLIEIGRQNDVKCISLTVRAENIKAISLYLKYGFVPIQVEELIEMEKWL